MKQKVKQLLLQIFIKLLIYISIPFIILSWAIPYAGIPLFFIGLYFWFILFTSELNGNDLMIPSIEYSKGDKISIISKSPNAIMAFVFGCDTVNWADGDIVSVCKERDLTKQVKYAYQLHKKEVKKQS